ncbi:MAG TPA: hypothetical protein VFW25_09845 [Silvibacterium sp.]|nr:hypothetical protein [Silvibacterium sp.]
MSWLAVIYRCEVLPIAAGKAHLARLCGHRAKASTVGGSHLGRGWAGSDASVAAIKAYGVVRLSN